MMEFKEKMLQFMPDAGLMYLIQQVTKQPSDEILSFFYEFGKEIFIVGIDNMEGSQRSIRKDIQAMYPNTAIPFKILVEGYKKQNWDDKKTYHISGSLYVSFPDNPIYMNTEKLIEIIMEKTLLGASSLPDFEPPKSRTPKMYRELIGKVLLNKGTIILNESKDT